MSNLQPFIAGLKVPDPRSPKYKLYLLFSDGILNIDNVLSLGNATLIGQGSLTVP